MKPWEGVLSQDDPGCMGCPMDEYVVDTLVRASREGVRLGRLEVELTSWSYLVKELGARAVYGMTAVGNSVIVQGPDGPVECVPATSLRRECAQAAEVLKQLEAAMAAEDWRLP